MKMVTRIRNRIAAAFTILAGAFVYSAHSGAMAGVTVEKVCVVQRGAFGQGEAMLKGSDEYPPRMLLGFNKPKNVTVIVDLKAGTARKATGPGFSKDAMQWPSAGPTKDGKYFFCTSRGALVIYDQKTDGIKMVRPIPGASWLRGIALAPDGRVYVSDYPTGSAAVYDPATGKMENFGHQGGPYNYKYVYGYSVGSDGEWVYTAAGKQPWYVVAYNLKTKKQKILRRYGPTDDPSHIIQKGENVYLKVKLAKGNPDLRFHEFYRLKGGRMERLNKEPYMWTGPKPPDTSRPKIVARSGRAWPLERDGKPVLRYRMPDGKGGWGEVRKVVLPVSGEPYRLMRIAPMKDGKLLIYTGHYGDVHSYDPKANKIERIGSPAKCDVYALKELNGKIYWAGYPNAPFGTFEGSTGKILYKWNKLLKGKHAVQMVYGADGHMYIGNHAEREAFGGSLGWYDLKTGKVDGLRFPNDDCSWLIATRDGKSMVYSSQFVRDPGQSLVNKSKSGRIMVFDIRERKVVRTFVPVPGVGEAGMIAEIRPGIILGLAWDNKQTVFYEADLAAGNARVIKKLSGRPDGDLKYGPDGKLYSFVGGHLVRIDPKTFEVTNLVQASRGSMAFIGRDLYLAGDVWLRRIRNVAGD